MEGSEFGSVTEQMGAFMFPGSGKEGVAVCPVHTRAAVALPPRHPAGLPTGQGY